MINISAAAASKITEILAEDQKQTSGLRVFVQGGGCSGFQYGLMIEERENATDRVFQANGIRLFVDPISVCYLKGAELDFIEAASGSGFTIRNPNVISTCGCSSQTSADAGGNGH
jgi:iron-sulfur cluster assembly accessory protein